jgi:hypothetical protein
MSNLSPRALSLYQAHGPGPVDWERMVVIVDRAMEMARPGWMPIETAPSDGTFVWVYTAARDGLPAFQGPCAYHRSAGWCTDELRWVTHWMTHPAPPADAEKSE